MLSKFCATGFYCTPHRKCSFLFLLMAIKSWTLSLIYGDAEIKPQNVSIAVMLARMSIHQPYFSWEGGGSHPLQVFSVAIATNIN